MLSTYASPWTNENTDNATSRKRVPVMGGIQSVARRTIKNRPSSEHYEVATPAEIPHKTVMMRESDSPESMDEFLEKQTDRNTKINSILNKITSFSTNDKLGDFNPMPYPATVTRKNTDNVLHGDEPVEVQQNPLIPKAVNHPFTKPLEQTSAYYRPSDSTGPNYANYREAYGKEGLSSMREPYYSRMGIGKDGNTNDKMMDRLNYVTQMLESMQMEKTNHVTEEFILYSLLGVFMIYIVDGVSRGGKYVR
jgi:hypothetical protein